MLIPSQETALSPEQSPAHMHHHLLDKTVLYGLQAALEVGLPAYLLAKQDYDFQPGINSGSVLTLIYAGLEIDGLRRLTNFARSARAFISHRNNHSAEVTE